MNIDIRNILNFISLIFLLAAGGYVVFGLLWSAWFWKALLLLLLASLNFVASEWWDPKKTPTENILSILKPGGAKNAR